MYLQISTIHDNCVISDNTPPRAQAAKYPLLIVRSFGMLRSGRRCTGRCTGYYTGHDWDQGIWRSPQILRDTARADEWQHILVTLFAERENTEFPLKMDRNKDTFMLLYAHFKESHGLTTVTSSSCKLFFSTLSYPILKLESTVIDCRDTQIIAKLQEQFPPSSCRSWGPATRAGNEPSRSCHYIPWVNARLA